MKKKSSITRSTIPAHDLPATIRTPSRIAIQQNMADMLADAGGVKCKLTY